MMAALFHSAPAKRAWGARDDQRGTTLVESMIVVLMLVLVAASVVPGVLVGLDDMRAAGAARYLSSRFNLARMQAVRQSRSVGIQFERLGEEVSFRAYIDGNGNGIRTAEIRRGTDRPLGTPERIEDHFRRVRFGVLAGVSPIDGSGTFDAGDDPVRFGSSDILTFTPLGTATSGTVYLHAERSHHQYAVRVLGATGRTRVLVFHFGSKQWIAK